MCASRTRLANRYALRQRFKLGVMHLKPMQSYSSVAEVLEKVRESAVEFSNLDKSPLVNAVGFFGNTPLHVAITWGDLEAVKLLVENGADINVAGERGATPLHHAISMAEFQIARYLVDLGANQSALNSEGKLPRDLCWEGEWAGSFGAKSA